MEYLELNRTLKEHINSLRSIYHYIDTIGFQEYWSILTPLEKTTLAPRLICGDRTTVFATIRDVGIRALRIKARRLGIRGYSSMNKIELEKAVRNHEGRRHHTGTGETKDDKDKRQGNRSVE